MPDEVSFAYGGAGSEAGPRQPADWVGLAGAGLIGAGTVLGLVLTFLTYRINSDHAEQVGALLTAALSTGVLVASAGLIVAGSWPATAPGRPDSRVQLKAYGVLLGAGCSAASFGVGLTAIGDASIADVPYLLLTLLWWLPVAAGSALSLARKRGLASVGRPGRPRRADMLVLALLAITAIGVMVTMTLPSNRYTFTEVATGQVETGGMYNAFTGPGAVVAGQLGHTVVVVAIAVAAALWRPPRLGAVFLTGAVVDIACHAITVISSVIEPPSLVDFGESRAQALRETVTVAATPWLWAFCGCVVVLIVLYEWLFTRSRPPLLRGDVAHVAQRGEVDPEAGGPAADEADP